MRILLVEDDDGLGGAVRDHLDAAGHAVDWATTVADADATWRAVGPDLVLLDLGLPDGQGSRLLSEARARRDEAPILVLSARDGLRERIEALNSGADDYLVKPFDLDELLARIAAVARRIGGERSPTMPLGDLEVDLARRSVTGPGGPVDVGRREWAVLDLLLRQRGAIVTKARIEEGLYALGAEVESNTIEVYVSRLRRKLGRDSIETVRGLGYRIAPP